MKIRTISPQIIGACNYYRNMGVLSKLDLTLEYSDIFEWHTLLDVDILFLERPYTDNHLLAIKYAKDFNLKIWIDYDDNLFCLPEWNPSYSIFNQQAVQDNIKKCCESADIITVPTIKLKEEFLKYNKNIEIVPNAHNDFNFPLEFNPSKNQTIFWRGSDTHRVDLQYVLKSMVEVNKNNLEWTWEFIGKGLWFVTDYIQNKIVHPELNIIPYFTRIKKINPAIWIVPLFPLPFNQAKSNCAWIESTYAGAVCLAPDTEEWHRPGIINYVDPEDFKNKLQLLIDNPDKRLKNYTSSYEYVKKNLVLSHVNKQREDIINKL